MDKKKLFEYSKLNGMALKNRFVMAPMTTMSTMDYSVNEHLIDYYEERAKGGVGLVILEGQIVSSQIEPIFAGAVHAGTLVQARQWTLFNRRLKGYGAKTCVQLTAGAGRNAGTPGSVSASEIPIFGLFDQNTRALTLEDIQLIIKSFGNSAAIAKASGFDAIEIHAHTGYLMDQFMSEVWNKRTDEYGGSLENRMRLPKEVIAEVRKVVGPDYPIIFRFSTEHRFPGGRVLEDGLDIVRALEDSGIDAFDIDDGSYEAMDWIFPPTYYGDAPLLGNAAAVKAITKKAVMAVGNFTPETAAAAVNEGKADYILIGRGLIADPNLVNKIQKDCLEDIRPCLRCNEYCLGATLSGNVVGCAINMQAGHEKVFPSKKADVQKNVAIVGGGPAGLEAARVAAEAGHQVTLYEKNDYLGGQVAAASTPEFKKPLNQYLKYLINQVNKLGVKVCLNHPINADSAELANADEIIVAVGAEPIIPKINGIDKENVIEVIDAHLGDTSRIGESVVIAGGGLSGCDYALELAMDNKKVTIVELMDDVATKALIVNKLALMKKLAEFNVNIMTGNKVVEITDNGIITEDKAGEKHTINADTVIVAFGTKPCAAKVNAICEKYPNAKCVGDCTTIGQVGEAVRAAYLAAWTL